MPIAGSVLSWLGKSHPLRIAHVRSLNEFTLPAGFLAVLTVGCMVLVWMALDDNGGHWGGGGVRPQLFPRYYRRRTFEDKTTADYKRTLVDRPPSDTQQRLAALSPWESPINKFCNGTIISHSLLAFNLKTFTSVLHHRDSRVWGDASPVAISRNSEGLFESRCLPQCLALVTTLSSPWIGHRRD
jgi:hypothetical protein